MDSQLLAWIENPARFVTEALGAIPEAWQAQALNEVRDHARVAIRSGHGVGKSALLSWLILWWMLRVPSKVACTAPTQHQLQDILWAELASWHRKMPEGLRVEYEWKSERFELKGAPNSAFAVARTARKENPEAFQGFHSPNMLFIADEASGVPEPIFEVGSGAMSTVGAKTVLAGNPTKTQGYFHAAFHQARGLWRCLHVPCTASSRVSPSYAQEQAALYGRDSNVYRVRVEGEFPTSEEDQVIPLDLCESAVDRDVHPLTGVEPIWGLDVARFGDDRTALAKRRGNVLQEPVKSWRHKDVMQVAGLVVDEYRAANPKPYRIMVDSIGIGAGVVDRLKEMGLPAQGVNVAERPSVKDRYMRLRDELWFTARDWLAARDCRIPRDDALIAELVGPHYSITSAGKVLVESKDEMKKRGVVSPDLADAFIATFAYGGVEKTIKRKLDYTKLDRAIV